MKDQIKNIFFRRFDQSAAKSRMAQDRFQVVGQKIAAQIAASAAGIPGAVAAESSQVLPISEVE